MKLNGLDGCFSLVKTIALLLVLLSFPPLVAASNSPAANAPKNQVGFERLEGDTIFFTPPPKGSTPKPLKTGLFEMSFLGYLSPEEGVPYLLFSAKPCQSCMDERAVYAIRPDGMKTSFVYPGRIIDPKTKGILLESRAFFGKCLPNKGDIYIVYQKERVDRRRSLQSSVLIAEAGKNYLAENLLERRLPRLQSTLQFVKKKSCYEVDGRNRLMLSKPLDLHPHSNTDQDDDDDDAEKEKEKEESPALQST